MSHFGGYQRPKSCSRNALESRRTLRHQQSAEGAHRRSEMQPKRSNSLQNLTTPRCKEQRKLTYKQVKFAWTRRTPSEEGFNYEPWGKATPVSAFDSFRKCERKNIDIFLSRGFIDPGDILPSPEKSSLAKMFKSAAKRDLEEVEQLPSAPVSSDPPEHEFPAFSIESTMLDDDPLEQFRAEKKVTFATEAVESKKLTAEARRQQFRNSYSKGSKSSSQFAAPEKPADCGCAPARNSITSNESLDAGTRPANCVSPSLAKQSSVEKLKQATAKRKLKSCRSRSFHKSLDSLSTNQQVETLPFVKPLRIDQPEVITMVSLLTGEERESDDGANVKTESTTNDSTTANPTPGETVSRLNPEKHFKSGILKAKLHTDDNQVTVPQMVQKPKLFITSKSLVGTESRCVSSTVSGKRGLGKTRNHSFDTSNCERIRDNESDNLKQNTGSVENETEKYGALQTEKEKECWSSFHKMTNKGLFVSFDTILRGLLTPTEYRLRKHELLAQE